MFHLDPRSTGQGGVEGATGQEELGRGTGRGRGAGEGSRDLGKKTTVILFVVRTSMLPLMIHCRRHNTTELWVFGIFSSFFVKYNIWFRYLGLSRFWEVEGALCKILELLGQQSTSLNK